MATSQAPSRIVILGGGTAGWLTAGYIASTVARTYPDMSITLVEAQDIGIIGVGEATIPTLRSTLQHMGIAEDDFLRNVNGAFKQAIRFQNWLHDPAQQSTYFYHPFHKASNVDILAAAQHLHFNSTSGTQTYAHYATPQSMACDANKAPGPLDNADKSGLTYAYHMDATLFGQFLRKRFEGKTVRRIEGNVEGAMRNSEGNITAVALKDGTSIEGDFFIDCSGFRGLLINQQLQVPFTSFSKWLPCDRALAISVPYLPGERIRPYTQATAQKNGWIWDINLASRRGVGHVYCSDYTDREGAEKALRNYLGTSWPKEADVRELKIRVGRCDRLWEHNCVAIGLAGGFIEPLESTGIYLIEMGIRYLVDHWPLTGITPEHRWSYNNLMHNAYDEVLSFVFMHYFISQRTDSDFWRDFKHRVSGLPNDLEYRLNLWRHKYPSKHDTKAMDGNIFGYESLIAILSGMDWFRGAASPYVTSDESGVRNYHKQRLREFEQQIAAYPSHEHYLATHGVDLGVTLPTK